MSTAPVSQDDSADEVARWLHDLESRVAEGGWDQPHGLWFIGTEPMGEDSDGNLVTVIDIAGRPFGLPAEQPPMAPLLRELRDELVQDSETRNHLFHLTHGELFAVALSSESWKIPSEDIDEWRGRNWSDHPRRTECRLIIAADRHRRLYIVERERGSDDLAIMHNRMGDHGGVGGDIPALLGEILDVLRFGIYVPGRWKR